MRNLGVVRTAHLQRSIKVCTPCTVHRVELALGGCGRRVHWDSSEDTSEQPSGLLGAHRGSSLSELVAGLGTTALSSP